MLFFSIIILLPYYSLIHRKILYINVTEYKNIDILIKLIRLCNNLNKSYILIKLIYIVHTYTHVHDIIHTRAYTCVHVHTYTHTHVYIYLIHIHFINIIVSKLHKNTPKLLEVIL